MSYRIQKIYIGNQKVRPSYYDYTPTSNTLAYYRMANDLNDYSGNNRNLSGTVTFSDNKMTNTSTLTRGQFLCGTSGAFSVIWWSIGNKGGISENDSGGPLRFMTANGKSGDWWGNAIINNSWRRAGNQSTAGTADDFVCMSVVYTGSQLRAYKNGVQTGTTTNCSGNLKSGATSFRVSAGTWGQIIIEKGAWSVSDIQTYYNNSKVNYGL